MKDTTFLDVLREVEAEKGRGNEELVRAMAPLLEQLHATHDAGKVGPIDNVEHVLSVQGSLWFHASMASEPTTNLDELARIEKTASGTGIDLVGHAEREVDYSANRMETRRDMAERGAPIEHRVYIPGYTSWELELEHQDALTDIFLAGMLFASLATGLDFTESVELQRFVDFRHRLTDLNKTLHPVLARAIVRMTELDRHERVQDLHGLIERLKNYRDVDERIDTSLDFDAIEGFVTADRSSRRSIIQSVLQTRLFDLSKRNRLIHFRPTQQMLDLTMASVPTQLSIQTIAAEDLFLWDGKAGEDVASGKPIRLDKYLRFEEAPWIKGTLDKARSEDRRSRTEVGFSQLRLVIAFLNWHNLKEDKNARIRSPLLLLPVTLSIQRGVRNSYVLQATSEVAEVNPVLRHYLKELYGLDLPDQVDLHKSDVATFHKALAAAINRSEPAVTLHKLVRPQIRLLRETAKRRTDTWRRRSRVTGRGLRTELGVDYSYSKSNFQPLGMQLYLKKVKPETFHLEEHLTSAKPVLPALPEEGEEPEEGEDPNVSTTTRQVYQTEEAAAGPYDWAVDLTHTTLGNFNYRKMTLVRDYDRMLEDDDGDEHPSFDRLFSLDAKDVTAPEPERASLDLFTVVPADPSQAAAIRWARTGKSLIIQGPPGTGKSQTITNLIADCAARGQRVLFVCQKRAALDVVYHRLAGHGLDQLSVIIHDAQADKKPFIDDLNAIYSEWTAAKQWEPVQPQRDALLAELQEPLESIGRFAESMVSPVHGGDCSVIEAMGERLRLPVSPDLDAGELESLPSHADWAAHGAAVHSASKALVEVGESPILANLALRHLSVDVLDAPEPIKALRAGLSKLEELLSSVRSAWKLVKPDATSAELSEALKLADSFKLLLPDHLSLLDRSSAHSLKLDEFRSQLAAADRAVSKAQAETVHWKEKLSPSDATTALQQAQKFDSMFFLFCWFFPAFWALRGLLNRMYSFDGHNVKPSYAQVLEHLATEHARLADREAILASARDLFGFGGDFEIFALSVEALRNPDGRSPLQVELSKSWAKDPSAVQALLSAATSIDELKQVAAEVFDGGESLPFDELEARMEETASAADLLPEVRAPLRQLQEAPPAVRSAVRTLKLRPRELDAAVCQQALDETNRRDRPLARFGHDGLWKRQIELSHGHHKLLAMNARLIRERVRTRFRKHLHAAARPILELNEEEVAFKKAYSDGRRTLEREFEKVMRHKSIRELSSGDSGTVVYDLKPIWLMSPLSISDTIPMDSGRFDVVIFDEASQIPLEEAVPAVYRAPQMIVVGDEMQLPPTNFFSSSGVSDDSEMDEATAEVHYDLDADSFLSHSARCLPSTMLAWHYRSRHEALIRFSNMAFYGGRLLTVPDKHRSADADPIRTARFEDGDAHAAFIVDRPVSYHRLDSSPYAARVNLGEARYIAHLVRGLLRKAPEHTVGIVAFSEAQQGAIERALEELANSDTVFRRQLDDAIEREDDGQLVGLFVKNLENVQGDERDIIILSVCYAPNASGKMRMNFGPINKGGGEKRLNVVFSRAKRHMAVVASIDPNQITNTYNDGANCMKRYLQYAEAASSGDDLAMDSVTNALSRDARLDAVKPPKNAVALALGEALEEEGLVVVPNVGSSQFRVDLAIGRDDDDALSVAVLIDSKEAYADFDAIEQHHVRPSVLRAFGWTVVHVLTKDWLADRAGCLARVLRALEDPASATPPPPPEMGEEPEPQDAPEAPEESEEEAVSFDGATVVLAGSFKSITRAQAIKRVQAAGGRVAKSVTRRTTFLVVGSRPGSKLHEAQDRGIRLLDEAAMIRALEDSSAEE